MPNHCHNRVGIYGDADQIKKVKKTLASKNTCFNFNAILPAPDWSTTPNNKGELPIPPAPDKEHDYAKWSDGSQDDRWYNWQCDNWGTKWNSYDCSLDEDEERLEYVFDTAWAPPTPVIDALREQYPDLGISAFYDEPGMEIAGYY